MIRRMLVMTVAVLAPATVPAQATPASLSSMSVNAEIAAARARRLPADAIRRRVAADRARGVNEVAQAVAAHKVRVTMEAGREAMLAAGREHPTDEEIELSGRAMERGYSSGHVQLLVKSARSGRSLAAAFDVLTQMTDRGMPMALALSQVRSRLEAREGDESLYELLTAMVATNTARPPR